jgi:hypothetical protein
MMSDFRKLVISLDGAERSALAEFAQIERRDPRDQAALIIREALEKRGLLRPDHSPIAQPDQAREVSSVQPTA